jgi:glycine dehydrogenase subunit 1
VTKTLLPACRSCWRCWTGRHGCLIVENPTFFGDLLEVLKAWRRPCTLPARCWSWSPNPIISLGLLKPPGAYGADIVVGEGQPLGLGSQLRRALPGYSMPRA